MKVYLNEINGLWNTITAMYFSKRSWTPEAEAEIKSIYEESFDRWGKAIQPLGVNMADLMDKVFKWTPKHITLGRFIDFAFTVEGLHRGAQDDFDSHSKRFENRIIRSSTRLSTFFSGETSDWYKDKIITTDRAAELAGYTMPASILVDGVEYVRAVNGYVRSDLSDSKDVKRGLYMLSIPTNFCVKVNATEFAHIVKLRDHNSHAHPELQECVEEMMRLVQNEIPQFSREYWYSVEN